MNPFKVGDVVIIEINEPDCKKLPRKAVVSKVHGPVIAAKYLDGNEPTTFLGSYIYLKLPE